MVSCHHADRAFEILFTIPSRRMCQDVLDHPPALAQRYLDAIFWSDRCVGIQTGSS